MTGIRVKTTALLRRKSCWSFEQNGRNGRPLLLAFAPISEKSRDRAPRRGIMRVRPYALLGAALALNLTALLSAMPATPARAAGEPQAAAEEPRSQLGSYLAGRVAGKVLDLPAAALFYEK